MAFSSSPLRFRRGLKSVRANLLAIPRKRFDLLLLALRERIVVWAGILPPVRIQQVADGLFHFLGFLLQIGAGAAPGPGSI
ncbi:MAG: hypothetical protein M0Q15_02035 [Nevskia sp.]|nr:hypothetical protein [Nevskia sp.]